MDLGPQIWSITLVPEVQGAITPVATEITLAALERVGSMELWSLLGRIYCINVSLVEPMEGGHEVLQVYVCACGYVYV